MNDRSLTDEGKSGLKTKLIKFRDTPGGQFITETEQLLIGGDHGSDFLICYSLVI